VRLYPSAVIHAIVGEPKLREQFAPRVCSRDGAPELRI
jgi:hypothetical protein